MERSVSYLRFIYPRVELLLRLAQVDICPWLLGLAFLISHCIVMDEYMRTSIHLSLLFRA
jgi:hypothetical protein